jgi:hypothetical protein
VQVHPDVHHDRASVLSLAQADATSRPKHGSGGPRLHGINKGGGNPSAQNKTTVAGPVSATGTFNSGKNGQVTASLTVDPPPSNISCPPGQNLQLAQVSYTDILLTDLTNSESITVPDVNSGCLLPNVRGACD